VTTDLEIPPLPDYFERIIVFIDVLGFARDVQFLDEHPSLHHSIGAVLGRVSKCKRDLDEKRQTEGVGFDARLSYFSDCLVLSFRPEPGAFRRALAHAAFLGQMILRGGYLPRGVICIGKLVHDENIVYGSGLIDAYEHERTRVGAPRIALTEVYMDRLRQDFAKRGMIGKWEPYIRDRGTGPFVHTLGADWPFFQDERRLERERGMPPGDSFRGLFVELRGVLPIRYAISPHEGARRKIEWMTEYVNASIDELGLPSDLKVRLGSDEHGPGAADLPEPK
jgi:hypothetical protein